MKGFFKLLKDFATGTLEIFKIGYSDALEPFTKEAGLKKKEDYQKQTAENTAKLDESLKRTEEEKAEMLKALNDWQKNRMKDLKNLER